VSGSAVSGEDRSRTRPRGPEERGSHQFTREPRGNLISRSSYRTASGHFSALCEEWDRDFAGRSHDFGPLGTIDCGALENSLHTLSRSDADRTVHALLTLAAAGDVTAERVVLQAMLPKTARLARTCSCLRSLSPADAAWSAFSAMWEAVKTYPLHRTTSVVGNLGLNALELINRTLGLPRDHVEEIGGYTDEDLDARMTDTTQAHSSEPTWGDSSFHDLVTVLTWAADTGTLTRQEIAILARADLGEDADKDALADELGSTRTTLSKRVWRIRTKLMTAVQEHIRDHGHW